jgi:hypothetical protein
MIISSKAFTQDSLLINQCLEKPFSTCTQEVKDAAGRTYKYIGISDSCMVHWICLKNQIIILDDVIISGDSTTTEQGHQIDSTLLAFFWNRVSVPCHSGDPNYTVVSFIVDQSGKIILFTVLEDLKNICDCNWRVRYEERNQFTPRTLNGRGNAVEYIMKINCPGYCLCEIIEKSTDKSVKKRLGKWKKAKKN